MSKVEIATKDMQRWKTAGDEDIPANLLNRVSTGQGNQETKTVVMKCVRVSFEIGHEASLRSKTTVEGFTHDWEVFVKGADNTEIYHFVEKVVFYLHTTFPKPKRVIKDPPYSVKESGYAGFIIPIEIYFKNKDEPKKVRFDYDLNLQSNGPPISKVVREKYIFPNPSEDLRRRLIKGGGVSS
uniref:YEATS domain-containing protein n=1 Tax=Timema poppense TaxID=170557 RepID=A0A7R9CMW2_TIMPO|nr:unnamed protein product [Timema poppensis]